MAGRVAPSCRKLMTALLLCTLLAARAARDSDSRLLLALEAKTADVAAIAREESEVERSGRPTAYTRDELLAATTLVVPNTALWFRALAWQLQVGSTCKAWQWALVGGAHREQPRECSKDPDGRDLPKNYEATMKCVFRVENPVMLAGFQVEPDNYFHGDGQAFFEMNGVTYNIQMIYTDEDELNDDLWMMAIQSTAASIGETFAMQRVKTNGQWNIRAGNEHGRVLYNVPKEAGVNGVFMGDTQTHRIATIIMNPAWHDNSTEYRFEVMAYSGADVGLLLSLTYAGGRAVDAGVPY